jgi:hypothetical protein
MSVYVTDHRLISATRVHLNFEDREEELRMLKKL